MEERVTKEQLDSLRLSLTSTLSEAFKLIGLSGDLVAVHLLALTLYPEKDVSWLMTSSASDALHQLLLDQVPKQAQMQYAGAYESSGKTPPDHGVSVIMQSPMHPADDSWRNVQRLICEVIQSHENEASVAVADISSAPWIQRYVLVVSASLTAFTVSNNSQTSPTGHSLQNLVHSLIGRFLGECRSLSLLNRANVASDRPIPRDPSEMVRDAGRNVIQSLFDELNRSAQWGYGGNWIDAARFMSACDEIAAARYEHTGASGQILVAPWSVDDSAVTVKFPRPVSLEQSRKCRKLLETVRDRGALVCDGPRIIGVSQSFQGPAAIDERVFAIRFVAEHTWRVARGANFIMQVRYGRPELVLSPFNPIHFNAVLARVFGPQGFSPSLLALAECAVGTKHGALIVITDNAAQESRRLDSQGFRIEPLRLNPMLAASLISVDGAILLDPSGVCHGFGVILDGVATRSGNSERGARFNSAIKYLRSSAVYRGVAAIFSADGTVDVLGSDEFLEGPADEEVSPQPSEADLLAVDPTRLPNKFAGLTNIDLRTQTNDLVTRLRTMMAAYERVDTEARSQEEDAIRAATTEDEKASLRAVQSDAYRRRSEALLTGYSQSFKADAVSLRDALDARIPKPFLAGIQISEYFSPFHQMAINQVIADLEKRAERLPI